MGPIIAFIWEVEILWWKRNSNLLVKKLELDFFGETSCLCVHKYHKNERVKIKKGHEWAIVMTKSFGNLPFIILL